MKEPRRLREESKSALERELLHSAASYRRPSATRAKTLAALGLGGSAALSAGAASGAASFLTTLGAAKVVASVIALSATIAAPAAYYYWHNARLPSPAPTAAPSPAPAAVTAREPAPVISPAAAPVSALDTAPVADLGHGSGAVVAKVGAKASAPAESAESLSIEIVALEAARKQLVRGDAKTALALLEEYGRAYPHGRLTPEAWVLRIDALAKNGENAAARARAKTFLQRYPKSVLAARVRDYLNE